MKLDFPTRSRAVSPAGWLVSPNADTAGCREGFVSNIVPTTVLFWYGAINVNRLRTGWRMKPQWNLRGKATSVSLRTVLKELSCKGGEGAACMAHSGTLHTSSYTTYCVSFLMCFLCPFSNFPAAVTHTYGILFIPNCSFGSVLCRWKEMFSKCHLEVELFYRLRWTLTRVALFLHSVLWPMQVGLFQIWPFLYPMMQKRYPDQVHTT